MFAMMKHTISHDRTKHWLLSVEQVLIYDLLPVIAEADQFIFEKVNKGTIKPIQLALRLAEDLKCIGSRPKLIHTRGIQDGCASPTW